jgi:hypothetical protein
VSSRRFLPMAHKHQTNRKLKPRQRVTVAAPSATNHPHSWSVRMWPVGVWPNDAKKAMYILRMHGKELLAAGALARVGRERIVIGGPFVRWIAKQASRIPDYPVAANLRRAARGDAQQPAP